MADQIPLKVRRTGADTDGLAEFNPGDTIPIASGGTGAANAADALTALGAAADNDLSSHAANEANPHNVTAAQAGADPAGSAATVQGNLATHEGNTSNPHGVTAVQAGAIPSVEKAANGGVASLDVDGKIPASQIPAVAMPQVHVVADAAARAALTVQEGDEAVQSDDGSHWLYDGSSWHARAAGTGSGDVVGPATSADNALVRFDGASGKVVQVSGATIDDVGNLSIPGTVDGRDVAADGAALDGHIADEANPHAVTAVQVGADPAGSSATVQGNLNTHAGSTSNPHSVTAVQAGAIPIAEKAANGGVASLDVDGKIPASQIPAVAMPQVYVVADAAVRASLTVQEGDEAVQADDGSHWLYDGSSWHARAAGTGSGDVVGPATSTNNALVRFDGASGKVVQVSGATIDDAGNLSIPGTVDGRDVAADGAALDAHVADETNPHAVTAVQVGADPAGSSVTVQGNLNTHAGSTSNPHSVTAVQAGAIPIAEKNTANGVCPTDANNQVPAANLAVALNHAGYVFADATVRDAYTPWAGLVAITVDNDQWFQYSGASWAAYSGVKPLYMIGAIDSTAVNGHLENGVIYDQEA